MNHKAKFAGYAGQANLKLKVGILAAIIITGYFGISAYNKNKNQKIQYQTAKAEKGTLINSISGSGSITSGNYNNISTKVSGVVNKVYVLNGDKVTKGQKIAQVTLDDYAKERQAAAWVSYLDAKEASLEAINARQLADITMWNARQNVLNAQNGLNLMYYYATASAQPVNTDGQKTIIVKTLDQTRKAFTVAESKYLNAGADIANTNAKVASAYRDYQLNSATIVAPSDGTVSDLSLAEGITVTSNSTTSNTSGATIVSAQTVGKINDPNGRLIASISLTEIDILKVKANQKVTLTLDAYPDKTFTGKVLAVNTSGSVSSGVTSYPVTILLDPVTLDIYPNMAVSSQIITNIKTDVILVPGTAVSTTNNQFTVEIIKNGKPSTVNVEIGLSNDSQTEIVSGINEGDDVITSTITPNTQSQTSTGNSAVSPFSGLGGRTGGNVRIFQGGPRD